MLETDEYATEYDEKPPTLENPPKQARRLDELEKGILAEPRMDGSTYRIDESTFSPPPFE